jgi:hypothetical protein
MSHEGNEGKPLATVRRSPNEELRTAWSLYNGHPYVSLRVWFQDQAGKWWPDSKRGCSVRIGELDEVRDAIDRAIGLAAGYRESRRREQQPRPDNPRSRAVRPHRAQTSHLRGSDATPPDHADWRQLALPTLGPPATAEPFSEFKDL